MRVLLDIDGVCSNFLKQTVNLFGGNFEEYAKVGGPVTSYLNINDGQMWKVIDAEKERFWSEMPNHNYYEDLIHYLKREKIEWAFCSKPSLSHYSMSGKMIWIQRRFGVNFRNFAITPKKHFLANPTTLLVDDHSKNTIPFIEAGGKALLVAAYDNHYGRIFSSSEFLERLDAAVKTIMH